MKPIVLKENADESYHVTTSLKTGESHTTEVGEKSEARGIDIVKVQPPLASNAEKEYMMVYNKDKTILFMTESFTDLKLAIGNSVRRYFEAEVSDYNEKREITLIRRVSRQDW